jgi:two-component system, NtrC family, response regulator HydG
MTGSEPEGPAGRVLVVEDDLVTASVLTHLLGEVGGFDVTHASDPEAALRLAREQAWDLVLTDVMMPGMSGLELLQALRQTSPELPVAVLTAHASLDVAVSALREHADEFLQKSVPPDQLLASVTTLVARGRATRLAARQAVLAIGAHPGDAEIGAAGALLVHRELGHGISILTLSGGAQPAESERAAAALGAAAHVAGLPDTMISEGEPTIDAIRRAVEQVQPSVIYAHSLHDVQTDHRNSHRAAMAATREVRHVYCFQSPSATVDFRPTRFVGIDEQFPGKLAAITPLAAQREVRACLDDELIESTARYWSRYGTGRYAEAFEVIRESAPAGQAAIPAARAAAPDGALAGA